MWASVVSVTVAVYCAVVLLAPSPSATAHSWPVATVPAG